MKCLKIRGARFTSEENGTEGVGGPTQNSDDSVCVVDGSVLFATPEDRNY